MLKNYYFKSSIYHLYHTHRTIANDSRFKILNDFRMFNKQNWIEYLKDNKWGEPVKDSTIWEYIDTTGVKDFYNKEILLSMMKSKTPIITICMVSYKRYDTLIKTLERYISFNVSINFMIWLNTYTDYTKSQLQNIKNICEKLYSCDITYCKKNMGTGHPRNIMLSRAYREYDTPYIMTTDDDILYNSKEELFIGASILEQKKYYRYGAIGIWGEPNYWASYAVDNELRNYKPKKGFQTVDALGAATMTIKKEVLSKCNVDPNYQIGWVDTDFSFQIRKNGYNLGLLCDDRWKPTNKTDKTDLVYRKERFKPNIIEESYDRFIKKWNISPKSKRNQTKTSKDFIDINFFWSGDNFDYLNFLTIKSHLKVGHNVIIHLHGNTPKSKYWEKVLTLNVIIKNADDIINITNFIDNGGNFRTASSLWRFKFLYEFGGWYSDCDALALKQWPNHTSWVLCSGYRDLISTGVLKTPANEKMFLYMIDKLKYEWGNVQIFNDAYKKFKGNNNPNFNSNQFYPFIWDRWNILLKDKPIPHGCYSVHLFNTMFEKADKLKNIEQWCNKNPNTMIGRLKRCIDD